MTNYDEHELVPFSASIRLAIVEADALCASSSVNRVVGDFAVRLLAATTIPAAARLLKGLTKIFAKIRERY